MADLSHTLSHSTIPKTNTKNNRLENSYFRISLKKIHNNFLNINKMQNYIIMA